MRIILTVILVTLFSCQQGKRTEKKIKIPIEKANQESVTPRKTHQKIKKAEPSNPCYYENVTSDLGIGLVTPGNSMAERFQVFNDSILTQLFKEVNTHTNEALNLCAKYNKHDYGILHFICLERTNRYFKIIVNHDEIKYLSKADSGYKFITWDEYIKTAYSIKRKREQRTNFIFENPSASSDKIELPKERLERFCVLKVQGEWLQVKYDCFENQAKNENELTPCEEYIDQCELLTGWIRWRRNNIVLVEIPYLS